MKKLLMIGRMNELTKSLNNFLQHYFRVQLCADTSQNLEGMIKVVEPDLILINLVGIFGADTAIFATIRKNFPSIPVITIGTEAERNDFLKFFEGEQFENLIRPIDNSDVFSAICRRLELSEEKVLEEGNDVEDDRKKVLVVDDNAMTLRTIKVMLDSKYIVTLANSGMKALTSIGKSRPDAILLDYEMPVCDGKQTLEMIRADEDMCDIPVIFL
ncbi:MAG: response regulator, partial [Lachnospiraceae bacterium]|nr:response regulator [Lachnospiraceae bacterium]